MRVTAGEAGKHANLKRGAIRGDAPPFKGT
jgi:hypothetical protein